MRQEAEAELPGGEPTTDEPVAFTGSGEGKQPRQALAMSYLGMPSVSDKDRRRHESKPLQRPEEQTGPARAETQIPVASKSAGNYLADSESAHISPSVGGTKEIVHRSVVEATQRADHHRRRHQDPPLGQEPQQVPKVVVTWLNSQLQMLPQFDHWIAITPIR